MVKLFRCPICRGLHIVGTQCISCSCMVRIRYLHELEHFINTKYIASVGYMKGELIIEFVNESDKDKFISHKLKS